MLKRALVLLAGGFEEIEAITPVDVLRRAGAEVVVAGLSGVVITGAHEVVIKAETWLGDFTSELEMLILPGGMPGAQILGESAPARALTEKMLENDKYVAAICAAPALTLGAWGMLDGHRATCYPGMESKFPEAVTFSSDRVVVDGKFITSRGPGTALEFSLKLAELLMGQEAAEKVARDMLVQ